MHVLFLQNFYPASGNLIWLALLFQLVRLKIICMQKKTVSFMLFSMKICYQYYYISIGSFTNQMYADKLFIIIYVLWKYVTC